MKKKQSVVLGMSGGVDSSVAALLLKRAGYEVHGYFMNCGLRAKSKWPSSIDWKKDEKILRGICKKLGIDLHMADCELGYEKKIIGPMFEDYKKGLTPNPDILCNTVGKFPNMIKLADKIGAELIATGHYARAKNGKLYRGKDDEKDQSYFISYLDSGILKRCLFPLGELKKGAVRKIAKQNGFRNYDKRSSRGICYLGKIDVKAFLRERIQEEKGDVVDSDGKKVGSHPGQMFFTVGERVRDGKGIILDRTFRREHRGKIYIAKKKENTLVVAEEGNRILKRGNVYLEELHLIDSSEGVEDKRFSARIRHLGELWRGKLVKHNGRWQFQFDRGVEGIAPGQILVFHKGERVVGCGEMRT